MKALYRTILLSAAFLSFFLQAGQPFSVKAEPRWPWNGKVDITVTLDNTYIRRTNDDQVALQ